MSWNNQLDGQQISQQDRSPDELPKLARTKQFTDAVERLGPLLESFRLEQRSREDKFQQLLNENKLLKQHGATVNQGQSTLGSTELFNKIRLLEKQLEDKESVLKQERAYFEQNFNRLTEENNELKARMSVTNNQGNISTASSDLINENDSLKKLLKERTESLQNIEAALNQQVDVGNDLQNKLKSLEIERNELKRNLDIYKNAHEEERKKGDEHFKEINDLREQRDQYRKNKEALQQEKRKLEGELLECKNRLSRVMGTKLSDNNPDIADLSDMNRPTKLAEKYSELYDNQWTDAFEIVEKTTGEIGAINVLLDLLQDMRDFCATLADTQTKELEKAAMMTNNKEKGPSQQFNKLLKDFRRATAENATYGVFELYKAKLQNTDPSSNMYKAANSPRLTPFVQTCLELCWLMAVQDPPVVLSKKVPGALDNFDTAIYKPYTQTGPYLDYLVWPPLYLHENGPLLAKGVAQAKKLSTPDVNVSPGSAVQLDTSPTESQIMSRGYHQTSRMDTTDYSRIVTGSSGFYDNAFPSTTQNMLSGDQRSGVNPPTSQAAQRGTPNVHTATSGDPYTSACQDPPSKPYEIAYFNYYVHNYGHDYAKEILGEESYNTCFHYSEYLRKLKEV